MASVNKVVLLGNLGRDPESRSLGNGGTVVSFSMATGESWRDKNTGERKERTEWHNVVIFNENIGKVASQYLRKGSKCYLEGRLRTREFTDKDGNQRRTTEIVVENFNGMLVLLDPKRQDGGGRGDEDPYSQSSTADGWGQEQRRPTTVGGGGRPLSDELDDSIPF